MTAVMMSAVLQTGAPNAANDPEAPATGAEFDAAVDQMLQRALQLALGDKAKEIRIAKPVASPGAVNLCYGQDFYTSVRELCVPRHDLGALLSRCGILSELETVASIIVTSRNSAYEDGDLRRYRPPQGSNTLMAIVCPKKISIVPHFTTSASSEKAGTIPLEPDRPNTLDKILGAEIRLGLQQKTLVLFG